MNANELYEIVKGVPREAWPVSDDGRYELVWRSDKEAFWWVVRNGYTRVHSEVSPVMCFEASMMRWLCRTLMASSGMPYVRVVAPEDEEDRWRIFKSNRTHCIAVENTFVEALAAACKAVAA